MTEDVDKSPRIGCNDGCKRETTERQAVQMAWQYLEISKRWRCPDCRRELEAINQSDRKEL